MKVCGEKAGEVEEKGNARDNGEDDEVFVLLAGFVVGGDEPGEDDEDERGDGSPEVEAADGECGLQPEDDEHAGDEQEPRPAAFAEEDAAKQGGGGENQNVFKRHLEALIYPRRAAVCGEDDEGDEDEAEEEGEEVFAGEEMHGEWKVDSNQ